MTTSAPAPGGGGGAPAVLSAVGCYTLWGVMPLMFMAMDRLGASAWEIVAHRTAWSVLWAAALVALARQGRQVGTVLGDPRTFLWLTGSACLIASNWGLFVWGVNHGHALEVSLGYYLNPLLNMAMGAALFGERLSRLSLAAIALAALGVLAQTAALGRLPWIGLALAVTFCAYGVIRKRVSADAQSGLLVECLVLAVPGVAFVAWLQATGAGHFGAGAPITLLLLLTGPATVAPLALFAWAARRLPLSTLGFIQFIGPTIQFAIGAWAGEPLTIMRIVSFGLIWAGVAVFVCGAMRARRRPPYRSVA